MKNILISVSGLTPQIITESLYCLSVKQKIPIHEVYVLTTSRGRDVIIGIDKHPSTPKTPLKREIEELCNKYGLNKPAFENNDTHIIVAKEESIELPDVRSDKQNQLFPNKAADFIKNKTSEFETTLYCVISGGRKSMSVHLAFALSVFGRENDKLLHVLTSEENEFKGFYPLNKKEHKELELSEIPFVRLRSIMMSGKPTAQILKKKFVDIVEYTQKQLHRVSDKRQLFINIENRTLTFDSNSIKLEPLEMALYLLFVEQSVTGNNKSFSINFINSAEFGSILLEFIKENYPYYYIEDKKIESWSKNGLDPAIFRSKRTKINSKLLSILSEPEIYNDYKIDSIKKYYETAYRVNAPKSKFKISY